MCSVFVFFRFFLSFTSIGKFSFSISILVFLDRYSVCSMHVRSLHMIQIKVFCICEGTFSFLDRLFTAHTIVVGGGGR